jgi:hypothetical protein
MTQGKNMFNRLLNMSVYLAQWSSKLLTVRFIFGFHTTLMISNSFY